MKVIGFIVLVIFVVSHVDSNSFNRMKNSKLVSFTISTFNGLVANATKEYQNDNIAY
jgi:hypothetical protein